MMRNLKIVLIFSAAVLTALTIWAHINNSITLLYILKPLTIVLIMPVVFLSHSQERPVYKYLIFSGLALSAIADFLILGKLLNGLIFFLLAHIVYIAAFSKEIKVRISVSRILALAIFAGLIFYLIAAGLGNMLVPVCIYMVVILVMIYQAWGKWLVQKNITGLLAFIGAILFVFSDSALSINLFYTKYEASLYVVLIPYISAQILFALSTDEALNRTVKKY